jgi:Uncharacterized low-complexity proteins
MANEEQVARLKKDVKAWNMWRAKNRDIDLSGANLRANYLAGAFLRGANLSKADLRQSNLQGANLFVADLREADLTLADLSSADLALANLSQANLSRARLLSADFRETNLIGTNLFAANLKQADLWTADLSRANLKQANLSEANLSGAKLFGANLSGSHIGRTFFGAIDLSHTEGLEEIEHSGPSSIGVDTIQLSKGNIPIVFLRGCGLSDASVEYAKLSQPDLSNEEINKTLYKIYDLLASQALQISPLFISYSHADKEFVDRLGNHLTDKGIRYWRDIHDMKAGRMEKQIDRAIRQNPTVLLILSEHSLNSDWVEHEVRSARGLEKELERDVLCPVALDDSWTDSRWPKRILEQIREYNILDFSDWQDNGKFQGMFRKLIDGLELFYKG